MLHLFVTIGIGICFYKVFWENFPVVSVFGIALLIPGHLYADQHGRGWDHTTYRWSVSSKIIAVNYDSMWFVTFLQENAFYNFSVS